MRSLVFLAIVFAVGSAICQTPPKLPQQFTTNFTGKGSINNVPIIVVIETV